MTITHAIGDSLSMLGLFAAGWAIGRCYGFRAGIHARREIEDEKP